MEKLDYCNSVYYKLPTFKLAISSAFERTLIYRIVSYRIVISLAMKISVY